MQVSVADKRGLFFEYVFWSAIDGHNDAIKAQMSDPSVIESVVPEVIRASEARAMRERLPEVMRRIGGDRGVEILPDGGIDGRTSATALVSAINEMMRERTGHNAFGLPDEIDANMLRNRLSGLYDEFNLITGSGRGDEELDSDERFIPLSPYDPRVSDRMAMRRAGGELRFVPTSQLRDMSDLSNLDFGRHVPLHKGVSVQYRRNGRTFIDQGRKLEGDDGLLTHRDDITGMTILAPYMTSDEYAKAADWVAGEEDLSTDEGVERMLAEPAFSARRESMHRAASILQGLSEMGRPYTIRNDAYKGQIKADIAGTKINVRLTERRGHQMYVGRVYDNGANVRVSSTRPVMRNGRPVRDTSIEVTPEETLSLLRFALGERVSNWDHPEMVVGEPGIGRRMSGGRNTEYNMSYVSANGFHAVIGDHAAHSSNNSDEARFRNVVTLHYDTRNRHASTTAMSSAADAEKYLQDIVGRARDGYEAQLDVERLIAEAEAHKGEEEYVPVFNPAVASIQQSYWDVLTGRRNTLLRPGRTAEEWEASLGEVGRVQADSLAEEIAATDAISYPFEGVEPADIVRRHARDSVEYEIGTYELGADGYRFSPENVAAFDTSQHGIYRNNDDIVKALRILGIPASQLRGNNEYNALVGDRLVEFDAATAVPMRTYHVDGKDNEFVQVMYNTVTETLRRNGVTFDEDDILFDEHGIVHWSGTVMGGDSRSSRGGRDPILVQGEIGQIFVPEPNGVVRTNLASSENYAFVPGYEAHVRWQRPGENLSFEERTVLRGYEQLMQESIRYTLSQDIMSSGGAASDEVQGTTTSLNNTYRRLYDDKHPYDFERAWIEQGMPEDVVTAIIATEARRVRYSNELRDGSTINAYYDATTPDASRYAWENDNFGDPFVLTGGRNLGVLTEASDGYFDPIATTSTSINQGTVRFLTSDARVTPDGHIVPGRTDGHCPLLETEYFRYLEFMPFDRGSMTFMNAMDCNSITELVGIAQMPIRGFTQDDGVVVRKRFADNNPMRRGNGSLTPLQVGDKVLGFDGNKGVSNLVVDPDMDPEEAERQGLSDIVELFRLNPDLDVVMAPTPYVSRYNASTAREAMSNGATDLILPGGEVVHGGIGHVHMIITDKDVEKKSVAYDEEAVAAGRGRRASGQGAWILTAFGADKVMGEFYGGNSSALVEMRETLLVLGGDISDTGELHLGYEPHQGEVRHVIELPEVTATSNINAMVNDFATDVSLRGGIIELPWPLTFATGEDLPPLNDGKTDVVYTQQEWERKGYTRKDGVYVRPTTVHRHVDANTTRQGGEITWGLPLMSSYMRSGHSFVDGSSSVHDYTNRYIEIYRAALEYKKAEAVLASSDASDVARKRAETTLRTAQESAQTAYDRIANDLLEHHVNTKHNDVRDKIMTHRLPNSATAVWTADPRLDLDEVAVGPRMAEALGLDPEAEGDQSILVWRDPLLRDGGMRYMHCLVDSRLTGCAINPNAATCFDGDFDGDTGALKRFVTRSAARQADELMRFDQNLLDMSHKVRIEDPDMPGVMRDVYPLFVNDGLDIKIGMYHDPSLEEEWRRITLLANGIEQSAAKGNLHDDALRESRRDCVKRLSKFYDDCYDASAFKGAISFASVDEHLQSIYDLCIVTGAKGSPAKLAAYSQYLGCDFGSDAARSAAFTKEGIDLSGMTVSEHTCATREMQQGVMLATEVKSFGTGIAGSVSQRGVRAMRDMTVGEAIVKANKLFGEEMKAEDLMLHDDESLLVAVTNVTYPVTQGLLQSKHDPWDAIRRFGATKGPIGDLWRGSKMTETEYGWKVEREDDGTARHATVQEWVDQFKSVYETSHNGFQVSVNTDFAKLIAAAMADEEGRVIGVGADADGNQLGSPMDRMAYEGTWDVWMTMMRDRRNLFEGRACSLFAPYAIRDNIEAEKQAAEATKLYSNLGVTFTPEKKSFVKSDTVESGRPRSVASHKKVSVSVRRPVSVPDATASTRDPGDFGDL